MRYLSSHKPANRSNMEDLKLGISMLNQIQEYIDVNREKTYGLLMEQLCFAASVPTTNIRIAIRAYKSVMTSGRNNPAELDLANEFKETMSMIYDYIRSSLVSLAALKRMDPTIVKELMKTEYSSKGFLSEMEVAQEETEEEASWLTNYEEDDFEQEYINGLNLSNNNDINDKLEV